MEDFWSKMPILDEVAPDVLLSLLDNPNFIALLQFLRGVRQLRLEELAQTPLVDDRGRTLAISLQGIIAGIDAMPNFLIQLAEDKKRANEEASTPAAQ